MHAVSIRDQSRRELRLRRREQRQHGRDFLGWQFFETREPFLDAHGSLGLPKSEGVGVKLTPEGVKLTPGGAGLVLGDL